jgi:hypothetical protein
MMPSFQNRRGGPVVGGYQFAWVAGLIAFSLAAPPAAGDVVMAFTSFEEPAAIGGQYLDPDVTDHELVNRSGQPIVQYTAGTAGAGVELGFRTFFSDNRGTGLSDGDAIGVTADAPAVNQPFPDGAQGYRYQDIDGTLTLRLDTVDLTPFTADPDLKVTASYFVSATTWEPGDKLRIWIEVDGGVELDIVSTTDVNTLTQGFFTDVQQALTGYTSATFYALLSSNANAEQMWLDHIRFTVPEPGSLLLVTAGLGLLAGRRPCVCPVTVREPAS